MFSERKFTVSEEQIAEIDSGNIFSATFEYIWMKTADVFACRLVFVWAVAQMWDPERMMGHVRRINEV